MQLARRLLSSGFLQVVFCLLLFDAMLCQMVPKVVPDWYYENFPSSTYQKVLGYYNTASNPSILVLGSSLVSAPMLGCDKFAGSESMPKREAQARYSEAAVLQKLVSSDVGKPVDILNLSMPACMVSDYKLILDKALECGKTPALVVCATAPAEFLSNDQPVVEATAVHQGLGFFRKDSGNWLANLNFETVKKAAVEHVDFVKQMLGCGRITITNELSAATKHPVDMNALHKERTKETADKEPAWRHSLFEVADKDKSGKNGFRDLALFRKRYNPPNYELFAKHAANFDEMLKTCHEKGIHLVVVNMPITEENKALMPPEMLNRYRQAMLASTTRWGVHLVDMDNKTFNESDFWDSCHLNTHGGDKWLHELAARLAPEVRSTSICSQTKTSL
jgi:hypothetical protein